MTPRQRRRGVRLAAAVALPLLAGCAGTGTIDYSFVESVYSSYELSYAGDGRDFAVTVRGGLLDGDRSDPVKNAVIAAMRRQPGWFRPNFTTYPGKSARPDYRVSWLLGVPAETPLRALCDDSVAIPQGKSVAVLAGVCRQHRLLSYAGGSLYGIGASDAPGFANLIKVTTRVLMPNRDPSSQGNNDHDFGP